MKKSKEEYKSATGLQLQAGKENFCLFLLKGMLGNMAFLRMSKLISKWKLDSMETFIESCINEIKQTQELRKKERAKNKRKTKS